MYFYTIIVNHSYNLSAKWSCEEVWEKYHGWTRRYRVYITTVPDSTEEKYVKCVVLEYEDNPTLAQIIDFSELNGAVYEEEEGRLYMVQFADERPKLFLEDELQEALDRFHLSN
jgi:hypothetical protein